MMFLIIAAIAALIYFKVDVRGLAQQVEEYVAGFIKGN